jgi:hypothetical protein
MTASKPAKAGNSRKSASQPPRAAASAIRSSFRATIDMTAKAAGMLRVEGEAVCALPGIELMLKQVDYLDGSTLVLEVCGLAPNGRSKAPPGRRVAVRYEMDDADEIEQVVIRSAAPAFAAPVHAIHH